jgi:esterase
VASLDLRNHGDSAHSPEMTYGAMAGDVAHTVAQRGWGPALLVGHSMGGKVAMATALLSPQTVDRLVVADIAPVPYDSTMRDATRLLRALQAVPLAEIRDRKQADAWLQTHDVPEPGVRSFVLLNLVLEPDAPARWQMNVDAIAANMAALAGFPAGAANAVADAVPYTGPTLFIRGAQSSFVRETHFDTMRRLFPNHELVTLPNAGHWVHADQPAEFIRLVTEFGSRP